MYRNICNDIQILSIYKITSKLSANTIDEIVDQSHTKLQIIMTPNIARMQYITSTKRVFISYWSIFYLKCRIVGKCRKYSVNHFLCVFYTIITRWQMLILIQWQSLNRGKFSIMTCWVEVGTLCIIPERAGINMWSDSSVKVAISSLGDNQAGISKYSIITTWRNS